MSASKQKQPAAAAQPKDYSQVVEAPLDNLAEAAAYWRKRGYICELVWRPADKLPVLIIKKG